MTYISNKKLEETLESLTEQIRIKLIETIGDNDEENKEIINRVINEVLKETLKKN